MCRMIIAAGHINMADVLDDFALMANNRNEQHENNRDREFRHGDGWGIAYLDNGRLQCEKYLKPCYDDPALRRYESLESPLVILHARKGSKGRGGVELVNTHPFAHSGYVFCHNGTVNQELDFDDQFVLQGKTDSEQLFYYLLSGMNGDFSTPYIARKLKAVQHFSGMNGIFSNGRTSFVINWYGPKPKYYTLKYMQTDSCFLLSSEILPHFRKHEWHYLNNRNILKLNTFSRKFTVYSHDLCDVNSEAA